MNKYLKLKNHIFINLAKYKRARRTKKERRELARIIERLKKEKMLA